MNTIRRLSACVLAGMLGISQIPGLYVLAEEDADKEFEELMNEDFIETMESDYLTMHFTVKDYEAMGIEKPEVNFSDDIEDIIEEGAEDAEEMLKALKEIDYDSLSDTHKHDYDAMLNAYTYQDTIYNSDVYVNYEWLFTPSNNVITNFSSNMIEFVFYEKQDFEDYVTVLKSFPSFLDDAIAFTEKQADAGYFMNSYMLDETLSQIKDFDAKSDDNPIISDFDTDADNSDLLSDEEKTELKSEVQDTVINDILPACEKVYDSLDGLRDKCASGSYYDMDRGVEYYTLALQDTASTTKSLQEQYDELDAFIQDTLNQYYSLLMQNQNAGDAQIDMDDPDEILSYLSENVEKQGFPEYPDVSYTAEYLDPSVVSGNVLAYYMSSPIDDYTENSIKINQSNISDNNTLYSTLAHEGYPGHLYQHVYYLSTDPSPERSLMSFLGYTEGWAMYAECQAFTWGGLSEQDAEADILDTELNYALSSLIDIGVNGMGWDVEDIRQYLNSRSLNEEIAQDVYESALTYPTDYNSYGYGLMKLMTLRSEAEQKMGSSFDETEFNKVILDNGPRTLDAVEEDVEAYMGGEVSSSAVQSGEETNNTSSSNTGYLYAVLGAAGVLIVAVILRARSRSHNKLA